MSNIFSTLSSAGRALEAQRYALEVTGQNIANVSTPGYARRTVDFAAVPPDAPDSAGRGVEVLAVRAQRDRLLEQRLLNELTAEQREAAAAQALSVAESVLGVPGESLDARLTEFFDAFSNLAQTPTSAVARQEVQLQGDALATAFRDLSGELESARRDADRKVHAATEEINQLARRIAANNGAIGATSGQGRLHLEDEQAALARQLSQLVDVNVVQRTDGGIDVAFGHGRPLVVADTAYGLEAEPVAPSGYARIVTVPDDTNVTAEISSGRLGGLLRVRDVNVPDYLNRLDTMAFETVQRVNALHAAGYDQNGAPGGSFFAFAVAPLGVNGAASAMTLNPAIGDDVRRIAAADAPQSGNNQTARAIAGLRETRVLSGNSATLIDGWAQLVYRVGQDTRSATDEQRSRAEIVRQADALRDQVSGISLDEEAIHLLKFQRAYEANARFFVSVQETIDLFFDMVAR